MGIPESQGPPIAVQLRPLGEQADPGPADALSIDCLGELWRGVGCRMAEFLLSVAVPSGHRLCVNSHPFEDLGVNVFFCDQVGKYALTSRTRVGRYLDDQPALHPRAHVFGVAGNHGRSWVPPGCLDQNPSFSGEDEATVEPCPFCGEAGLSLRLETLCLRSDDGSSSGREVATTPFRGALWTCKGHTHVWGWRARRTMEFVMAE